MMDLRLALTSALLLIARCEAAQTCQADIVFSMDVSRSITRPEWENHVTIAVEDLTARMTISQDAVRVATVSFNETAFPYPENGAMLLNMADSRDTVLEHLNNMIYHRGGTCIECGLMATIDNFVAANGDRADIPNYGIFISDGNANVRLNFLQDAISSVHAAGITMFVLAVSGEEVPDRETLAKIAGDNGRVFYIENPRDAEEALDQILTTICGSVMPEPEDPCKREPCKNGGTCIGDIDSEDFTCECPPGYTGVHCQEFCNKMDLAFILDSSSSIKGTRWRNTVVPFVKGFVDSLSLVEPDAIHVASVTFSHESEVDFRFNEVSQTLDAVQNELDNLNYIKSTTCIACGLRDATDQIFQEQHGERRGVPNVAILFTDGKANVDAEYTVAEAERLKEAGTLLFAVGVTGSINETELMTIVSQPYEQFFLKVDNFNQLLESAQMISGMACAKSAVQLPGSRKRRDVDAEIEDLVQASVAGSRIARHATR